MDDLGRGCRLFKFSVSQFSHLRNGVGNIQLPGSILVCGFSEKMCTECLASSGASVEVHLAASPPSHGLTTHLYQKTQWTGKTQEEMALNLALIY